MKSNRLLAGLLALAMTASLAGCGAASSAAPEATEPPAAPAATEAPAPTEAPASPEAAETAALRVAGLKGPTTMGLINLVDDVASGEADYGFDLEFSMHGAADEIVPILVQGELEAATLYQKTNGAVQVAAINTLGVLYVLEQGDSVQSVADLAGQTILTTGKGTTPEYVLRYVLSENGLDPDTDVTIEYFSEATEALAHVQAGAGTIAMLPQPFVTSALSQVEGLRVALDMNTEWEAVAGSKLVTGVLVARTDAIEANPEAFSAFLTAYETSTELANSDLEGTAALCEEYGIVAKAALAQKALPECNIVFETGSEMKTDLATYFQVLYDADPASVGGAMPDDAFYYGVAG